MRLPDMQPMPLVRLPQPFDDPAWLFELKLDGFRALAYLEAGRCRLVSRNGHTLRFPALSRALAEAFPVTDAIVDGEIVCLDGEGRSRFNDLLFRRATPVFAAFDLLWLDGRDLRSRPLLERKRRLSRLVAGPSPCLLYVQHVEAHGVALFTTICDQDLEGVVGKLAGGTYISDGEHTSWVKIKNAAYSQAVNRAELFKDRASGSRPKKRTLELRLA